MLPGGQRGDCGAVAHLRGANPLVGGRPFSFCTPHLLHTPSPPSVPVTTQGSGPAPRQAVTAWVTAPMRARSPGFQSFGGTRGIA
jgi:hypothetical protein